MIETEENGMKNTMNEITKAFIEKLQKVGMELYEEYNSLDINGIKYTCPLTNIMDELYGFSLKDLNETIKEN